MDDKYSVAVLLASYNGSRWIAEQLHSIYASTGVATHVFLSDDGSTDDTIAIAKDFGGERLTVLPQNKKGKAGQNFIRLMTDVAFDDFDYVALSDQDDIWRPDKLQQAVNMIQQNNLDAYSSSITAFWPDGREKYIQKSQPMRKWDYLFESAGPGNTYVFPVAAAHFLQTYLQDANPIQLRQIDLHDWLFYAIFRQAGKLWLIDDVSGLLYRQHDHNVLGAASGLGAIRARLRMVKSGWYRHQILTIGTLANAHGAVFDYVRAPTLRRWWAVISNAFECRRKGRESLFVAVLLLLSVFQKRTTS